MKQFVEDKVLEAFQYVHKESIEHPNDSIRDIINEALYDLLKTNKCISEENDIVDWDI